MFEFFHAVIGRPVALLLLLLPGWFAQAPAARAAEVPVIAAASDLQYALGEISNAFTRASGRSVRIALGSSGNLTSQILQGAPFELFFSADEAYVRRLVERSLTLDAGELYAVGRLVIFVSSGSAVKADAELNDLAAAVSDGRLRKLAIANPEHAPYGRAARAALMRKGIWDALQSRLVLGENISQAAQFAVSGSAEAGLIAYSLAVSESMSRRGAYALVPQEWHAPLRQRMVLLKAAGDTVREFYRFVQSPTARAILDRYGFVLPAGLK